MYSYMDSVDDAKSFPEDLNFENGCYMNECFKCKAIFLGHKRRRICKLCEEKENDDG